MHQCACTLAENNLPFVHWSLKIPTSLYLQTEQVYTRYLHAFTFHFSNIWNHIVSCHIIVKPWVNTLSLTISPFHSQPSQCSLFSGEMSVKVKLLALLAVWLQGCQRQPVVWSKTLIHSETSVWWFRHSCSPLMGGSSWLPQITFVWITLFPPKFRNSHPKEEKTVNILNGCSYSTKRWVWLAFLVLLLFIYISFLTTEPL